MKAYFGYRIVTGLIAGLLIAVVLSGSVPARAATILFQDNFESPAFSSGADNDPNNGALPGNWDDINEDTTARVQVSNATSPSQIQGAQYLAVSRSGVNTWAGGALASPASTGVLITTFQTFVNGSGGFVSAYSFTTNTSPFTSPTNQSTNSSSVVLVLFYDAVTGKMAWRSGTSSVFQTTVPIATGVWQSVKVEMFFGGGTAGKDAFKVTVGANTSALIDYSGVTNGIATGTDVDRFYFTGVTTQTEYLDSLLITIPEPASLALLGLSGAVLLGRRRVR